MRPEIRSLRPHSEVVWHTWPRPLKCSQHLLSRHPQIQVQCLDCRTDPLSKVAPYVVNNSNKQDASFLLCSWVSGSAGIQRSTLSVPLELLTRIYYCWPISWWLMEDMLFSLSVCCSSSSLIPVFLCASSSWWALFNTHWLFWSPSGRLISQYQELKTVAVQQ